MTASTQEAQESELGSVNVGLDSENPAERAAALSGMTVRHPMRGRGRSLGARMEPDPAKLPIYSEALSDPHPFVRCVALGCVWWSSTSQSEVDTQLVREVLTKVLALTTDMARIEVPDGYDMSQYNGLPIYSGGTGEQSAPATATVAEIAMTVVGNVLGMLDRVCIYDLALSINLSRNAAPDVVQANLDRVDVSHQVMLFEIGQDEGPQAQKASAIFDARLNTAPFALPLLLILKAPENKTLTAAAMARAEELIELGQCGVAATSSERADQWTVSRILAFEGGIEGVNLMDDFHRSVTHMVESSLSSARWLLIRWGLDSAPEGAQLLQKVNETEAQVLKKLAEVGRSCTCLEGTAPASIRRLMARATEAAGSDSGCKPVTSAPAVQMRRI